MASRFMQVDAWSVPHYFALKPGEFLQGLLASIGRHKRVYVVTVPLPAEHAHSVGVGRERNGPGWMVIPRPMKYLPLCSRTFKAPRRHCATTI
ncbi:MAG: hypothetical protein V4637_00975 [Pseudomonadota bacterium]